MPLARFCTSISEKSIAGAAAETGTFPDSAPHIPLKTSIVSPVSMMLLSASSGVPTISTPRTNWSGRPSGIDAPDHDRQHRKACGEARPVSVNPP